MTMCADHPADALIPAPHASRSSGRMRAWVDHPRSDAVVVHVAGDVDAATAGELATVVLPALATVDSTVVVDLAEVEFLGVAGLELLWHARRRAHSLGVDFWLIVDSPPARRALEVSGLTPRFQIADSLGTALYRPVEDLALAAASSVL